MKIFVYQKLFVFIVALLVGKVGQVGVVVVVFVYEGIVWFVGAGVQVFVIVLYCEVSVLVMKFQVGVVCSMCKIEIGISFCLVCCFGNSLYIKELFGKVIDVIKEDQCGLCFMFFNCGNNIFGVQGVFFGMGLYFYNCFFWVEVVLFYLVFYCVLIRGESFGFYNDFEMVGVWLVKVYYYEVQVGGQGVYYYDFFWYGIYYMCVLFCQEFVVIYLG